MHDGTAASSDMTRELIDRDEHGGIAGTNASLVKQGDRAISQPGEPCGVSGFE